MSGVVDPCCCAPEEAGGAKPPRRPRSGFSPASAEDDCGASGVSGRSLPGAGKAFNPVGAGCDPDAVAPSVPACDGVVAPEAGVEAPLPNLKSFGKTVAGSLIFASSSGAGISSSSSTSSSHAEMRPLCWCERVVFSAPRRSEERTGALPSPPASRTANLSLRGAGGSRATAGAFPVSCAPLSAALDASVRDTSLLWDGSAVVDAFSRRDG